MKTILVVAVLLFGVLAFVSHETKRDMQDVTGRDIARTFQARMPVVQADGGQITIKQR